MPSVDGEENGEEEVERSPNEDENMSEEEEEESSLSSDESSSESSIDETENERRRNECLNDMADLERQFSDLKEQLYRERISQVEKKLDEVQSECAMEYTGPVSELKEMCEIRIEVAGNVRNKYDADEQAAKQHYESEKLALMESMKQELEEKIRKLEEDKQNMDISAGGCQSEKSPFSARYEDGKLYYEGEWFHKGDHVLIESRNDTQSSAIVTGINTGEVWVRKGDGSKTKLDIGQLLKGKYRIKES
ncbi:Breast cancer metastasis-suppressor 1-like protein-A [Stylophora pistillata]|uniref:Breast cancer metastasis-suppressor 1-like protein-A n=1 Tax=Stylophora pistillata TaxID=50429 RepID=A0A2B4R5H7_STYPI|nr:Breast cancer metastasis-suppressor 1-like protein-A [Stylophora pistillata]